ncbi:M20 family peptidase [Sneathiella chinensis]|uniref:Peptidase M20 n=1 Tax=Sneathiella chinensis TaxID=349750 RepID=A0ABQ5U2M6_9PROT|nr:M20 family peptidase [Sneathiella chinensis]GLQ05508.1 peptidase M20 [Sneathiella chinensis]
MIKRILLLLGAGLLVLIGVLVFNTLTNTVKTDTVASIPEVAIDTNAAALRLATAVTMRTISHAHDAPVEVAEFEKLHAHIDRSYPLVAANLKRQVIGGHSLLYRWEGSNPSLKPILLMGHMDVVPIEPGTEDNWDHPPFSGKIVDGAIWGRGTLDDKLSVFAILEAAEYHLAQGHQPERSLYFAFGHDEEVGGKNGAGQIAAYLKEQGVQLAFTLDEGMVIVQGLMPGIDDPIAFIALAEKGYLTVHLTATATGGHSSMPPRETAVGKISKAITRLEENRLPAALRRPVSDMLETLSPHMPLSLRSVISNRWLLEPVLVSQLAKGGTTNAMVRTTTAATIVNGGTKDNVLPSTATATVNFRLLPGDTVDGILDHIRTTINDPAIEVSIKQGNEPSKVSSSTSDHFALVQKTINEVLPDVLVSPGLMLAGSDTKHYEALAEDSYRFLPMRFSKTDLPRVHGTNERIMIDNYAEIIRFYIRLMENAG